jgi:H+-transporting ATPase
LIFNFYPVTAVMIVMIALLNDGAILSIAYDNVHYRDKPEAWNMRLVLGVSTVLGVIGVVAAFGLFYLAERVFHLDRAHAQTMMYLKLSVAGHLTIFLTRTRGPFWSIKPAKILWMAVLGTQIIATLIAVYGLFMTPLGWGWAAFVWGYALVWFLINDRVKLLAYRIFDHTKAGATPEARAQAQIHAKTESEPAARSDAKIEGKPQATTDPKAQVKDNGTPEAKAQPKSEAKTEPTPQAKADSKPESDPAVKLKVDAEAKPAAKAKISSDLTPQISKRAYELYEKRGRQSDHAVQDWEQAKQEIGRDETKTEPEPQAKLEPKSEAKTKTPSDLTPQLVKRVHELYEELGRKDVRAVQELEKAEREAPKVEPHK